MPETQKPLTVTVDEFAKMAGISRGLAFKACNAGEIPCIRIGRRMLIARVVVDRILRGEAAPPAQAA